MQNSHSDAIAAAAAYMPTCCDCVAQHAAYHNSSHEYVFRNINVEHYRVLQQRSWWRRWAYEQVAEALCKLYRDPAGPVGQHLLYGSSKAGCPGLLADALLDLAQGLAEAHVDIRYSHACITDAHQIEYGHGQQAKGIGNIIAQIPCMMHATT